MPASTATTPLKVLSVIHNLPRRARNKQSRDQPRFQGKENIPPHENAGQRLLRMPTMLFPSPSPHLEDPRQKWLPKDGMIIIKVSVPYKDDIWKFKVPEDVTHKDFLERVEKKVGNPIAFAHEVGKGRERLVATEKVFKAWVVGRVQNGKNTKLIAHVRF